MSKTGLFGLYGGVSVVGVGCFTALIFSGQQIELQTAVLGFYGFLSTTALFYVMFQSQADAEDFKRDIQDQEAAIYRHIDRLQELGEREHENIRRELIDEMMMMNKTCSNKK